ncbi:hypothetical protein PP175_15545 [Aneurinibacillus sp. Ricciae_BoGa-3]|uniref:hypothetical protein n=1 Tax=Aneurinibacillus sp. Ricciae_BoGa-3 TaxID=3022697 RepID=UPI002340DEBF|nr:hypothetical protein [Aneurinibacillus sp. Ricciae_BoGa-3]WCK52835.1 hypothetical protein PP175_15545 [Aneurinibacillus sp. Ricciae_BoGa-3]
MNIIAALFSILMPGTGQMFNKQFIKGVTFMFIEHWDNVSGHINQAIYLDLIGFHKKSWEAIDYTYAPFYPGFYVYVVWDAAYRASSQGSKLSAIIFVIAGFLGEFATLYAEFLPFPALTIGLIMIIPMLIGLLFSRLAKGDIKEKSV